MEGRAESVRQNAPPKTWVYLSTGLPGNCSDRKDPAARRQRHCNALANLVDGRRPNTFIPPAHARMIRNWKMHPNCIQFLTFSCHSRAAHCSDRISRQHCISYHKSSILEELNFFYDPCLFVLAFRMRKWKKEGFTVNPCEIQQVFFTKTMVAL